MIKKYSRLIITGCLFLLIFPLPFTRYGWFCDNLSANIFYRLNKKNTAAAKNIVLVAIDDRSLQKINQKWPFLRSLYAQALNILDEEKAKVVGIDLILAGESGSGDDDIKLAETLKRFYGKVILAYRIDNIDGVSAPAYPSEKFKSNAVNGFINAPADNDNVVRRLYADIQLRNFADFSFAVKLAAQFYDSSPAEGENHIALADKKLPVDKNRAMDILYLVKPADIAAISFTDLLSRNFPKNTFEGKIVLMAATSEIIHDIMLTPLGRTPGVFVHINGIVDILEDKFVKPLPDYLTFIIFAVALFAAGTAMVNFSFLESAWFGLVGITASLLGLHVLLKFAGWSFPVDKLIALLALYLFAGNILLYFSFRAYLDKIKNKMFTDPLTNLANVRYFCERVNFAAKAIPRREKYLIAVTIKGSGALLEEAAFSQIKDFWQSVSQTLFAYAKHGQTREKT